jgi:hypothetical protein
MDGILHRSEAISKNSCPQQPIQTRELAGAFEQAAILVAGERRTGKSTRVLNLQNARATLCLS